MSKKEVNSIIEPTDEELKVYNKLIKDIDEKQLDVFVNEYFELVKNEEINISFPRFMINKLIRPISEGDTISIVTEENEIVYLFCLIRKEIEGKIYLLFAKVAEDETLYHDEVYLFYVCDVDNIGTEVIDIIPVGEESERILSIIEGELNVNNKQST